MAFLFKAATDVKYFVGQFGMFWQKSNDYTYNWEAAKRVDTLGFSVGTYNVNYALSGMVSKRQAVIKALTEMDCDCVLIQECCPEWVDVIRTELKVEYPHMGFCDRPGVPSSGMGIISKHPLEVRVVDTFSQVEGSMFQSMVGRFNKDGKEVQCVNVHLRPPLDPTATLSSPSNTNSIRLEELRYITSHLNLSLPTVIGGDFNEQDTAPGLSYLQQSFMSSCAFIPPYKETHRWPLGPTVLMKRLDHILCNKHLYLATAGVLVGYEDVSDHQPVVAAFTFN
eukprot:TRINITY_DN1375_c0_g1_i1.p1 TRINITY_DN1375_c0_g1~~TRINITY_DN1375_c0_g1_i1.p1  ORF type:complete len:281 (+),score=89.18 TRINITY_DN1375_c0_g1_i1:628-1470(+)